jgi:hypothetical protein
VDRAYEMVSPVFKGGFGAVKIEDVGGGEAGGASTSDGEAVVYYSPGAFAGAPSGAEYADYLARRGDSGWTTEPLIPPAQEFAFVKEKDISPSLDTVLVLGKSGPNSENENKGVNLALHATNTADISGNWDLIGALQTPDNGASVIYVGGTPDFCHIALFSPAPLLEGATGAGLKLYEFLRGCGGEEETIRLVGMNNAGKQINSNCTVGLGNERYDGSGQRSTYNAVDIKGDEVFFSECSGAVESSSPHQLYVRLAGVRTLEVSAPLNACQATKGEVPCQGAASRPSANFAGASSDGSKVYFTTAAPLVEGDKDTSNDLYMATIDCPEQAPSCEPAERELTSQVQVSHDPNGGAAEVLGVVRVAPDGRRVYFVARGDLLSQTQQQTLESEGRPIPEVGAANLYVYDAASPGSVAFIGMLCSGKERSGTIEDTRCPSATGSDAPLWAGNEGQAQTAGADGRYLIFGSFAQLTGDDADAAEDIYRYDAETGALERVSVGEDGADANGNLGGRGATIAPGHHGGTLQFQDEMDNRTVSEDGTQIVFTSADPLSPAVSNGLANAYEWREGAKGGGAVSLISSGSSEEPVTDVVISPGGSSVFFETVDGLVPQDTDGAPDIYDARLGGGFPAPNGERRPCEGDACQGPLSSPTPLLIPASVSQAPGGNLAPAKPAVAKKKNKKKAKRASGHRRRGHSGSRKVKGSARRRKHR